MPKHMCKNMKYVLGHWHVYESKYVYNSYDGYGY